LLAFAFAFAFAVAVAFAQVHHGRPYYYLSTKKQMPSRLALCIELLTGTRGREARSLLELKFPKELTASALQAVEGVAGVGCVGWGVEELGNMGLLIHVSIGPRILRHIDPPV
jgi:hypothetical protein